MGRSCAAVLLLLAAACGREEHCPSAPGAGVPAALCPQIAQLALPAALPPARGNRYADDVNAATLGHRIFFDARFSNSLQVRCATCHQTERSFQDGAATPPGFPSVHRRTPTVINAARLSLQFWDGRADSLWSQALFALENPGEMNFTRLEIAHLVDTTYRARYEPVFGALPDFSDTTRFPPRGAPGDSAWQGMAPADQERVNRVAANVGKSLEAYQRKATAGPSRVDAWLSGDRSALSAQEAAGVGVFARAGCLSCHAGPMLTDERYHVLGVPGIPGAEPDRGRAAGLAVELANPFNARGAFFDPPAPPPDDRDLPSAALEGAFRTPSLRNLTKRPPYGHNGSFATLEDAVDFHLRGGGRGGTGFAGQVDPLLEPHPLSPDDRAALLSLLRALDGRYPGIPWSDWPRG
jgi:cytochrome c peroxidase